MANPNMTAEQDLLIRCFMTEIASDPAFFPGDAATQKLAYGICLDLLGYVIVDGKFVSKDLYAKTKFTLNTRPEFDCEWDADTRRVEDEALADTGTGERQADSSEPTKSTPLWKAVFSKDV